MSENHDQLIAWINKVENQINLVKQDFIKNDDFKLIYMIGSTSSSNENSQPYTTPIRKISNAYIIGSIVFTQAQAKILAFKIDGQVDFIFLDAEKKLPTTVKPDYSPYRLFNLKHLVPKKKDPIEFGNISAACVKIIKKSIVQEYKANDVTVDATWNFLTNRSVDFLST